LAATLSLRHVIYHWLDADTITTLPPLLLRAITLLYAAIDYAYYAFIIDATLYFHLRFLHLCRYHVLWYGIEAVISFEMPCHYATKDTDYAIDIDIATYWLRFRATRTLRCRHHYAAIATLRH